MIDFIIIGMENHLLELAYIRCVRIGIGKLNELYFTNFSNLAQVFKR
jgi:hypothetical protein